MAAADMGPMPKFPHFPTHRCRGGTCFSFLDLSYSDFWVKYWKPLRFLAVERKDSEKPYRKIYGALLVLPHVLLAARLELFFLHSIFYHICAPYSLYVCRSFSDEVRSHLV